MAKRLTEGTVVQSGKFVNGISEDGKLFVGDYIENSIGDFSKGIRENDAARADKQYVIVACWEMEPGDLNLYQNRFVAKELNGDGTYNENGEEIHFSTAGVYRGSIKESDITIIKVMKKIFV